MTKSLIIGKSFFFGYESPMLTAAIASWHRLCGKRYLNVNQNSQPHYSTIIWGYFGPKVSNESQRGLEWAFQRAVLVVAVAVLSSNGSIRIWSAGPLN